MNFCSSIIKWIIFCAIVCRILSTVSSKLFELNSVDDNFVTSAKNSSDGKFDSFSQFRNIFMLFPMNNIFPAVDSFTKHFGIMFDSIVYISQSVISTCLTFVLVNLNL